MHAPAANSSSAVLRIEGVTKCFVPSQAVFRDVWFDVQPGEFICLIGHSGCGKTTFLNMLAGLDQPTAGALIANGREIAGPSVDRAVVFQGHALMPWMTVLQNVEFAVESRWPQWSRDRVRSHAMGFLELVHLADAGQKRPSELSGGMRQRVGIARALSIEPSILLMDEPFSALDALTRGSLQDELVSICRRRSQTTLMITHDIDEAILLSDRIVLMTSGPEARLREIVENTLPKDRTRADLHRQANYAAMRLHLLEFLVNRSKESPDQVSHDARFPPVVRPTEALLPTAA